MKTITEKMKEHYSKTFNTYGANVQGVDWGKATDTDRLELRYKKMLEVIERSGTISDDFSILDVGCGYGGLYQYAINKGYIFNYTGIDVCENMIQYAQKNKWGGVKLICGDIFDYTPEEKYTFVICNGILTQKLNASIKTMDEYARSLINKMWELSDKGMVFNIMKSQVDFMNENLYYKSPLEILAYCMTFTDKFILDSSYPLYEYSVYLYKK
jgi:SAM-dependent methyltransferase